MSACGRDRLGTSIYAAMHTWPYLSSAMATTPTNERQLSACFVTTASVELWPLPCVRLCVLINSRTYTTGLHSLGSCGMPSPCHASPSRAGSSQQEERSERKVFMLAPKALSDQLHPLVPRSQRLVGLR